MTDAADDGLVGHLFLDLLSRPGKYGHQCVLPLAPAFTRTAARMRSAGGDDGSGGSGERVRPACAILGNMSAPVNGRPALLRFNEVRAGVCECVRGLGRRHTLIPVQ